MMRLLRVAAGAAMLLPVACGGDMAQRPIQAVALRPIGDAKNWMLTEPLVYRIEYSDDSIVVPIGFVTDFASIPPALQSLISPLGPYVLPAVVHDFLYWGQGCSKPQADSIFLIAMAEMRVPESTRNRMYQAVNLFGGAAWSSNQAERRDGLPRIVPATAPRLPGALESWPAYRLWLRSAGVAPESPATLPPEVCAHGGPAPAR